MWLLSLFPAKKNMFLIHLYPERVGVLPIYEKKIFREERLHHQSTSMRGGVLVLLDMQIHLPSLEEANYSTLLRRNAIAYRD